MIAVEIKGQCILSSKEIKKPERTVLSGPGMGRKNLTLFT